MARRRNGSGFTSVDLRLSSSVRTAVLVGWRTQSRRRRTMKGKTTFPYSDCLYSPRRRSATDQRKLERFGSGIQACVTRKEAMR